jgi:hypothetical protein
MGITRRQLLVTGILGPLISLIPAAPAHAFWPFLLRFVVGGAIRGTATRTFATTAARSVITSGASTAARASAATGARSVARTVVSRSSVVRSTSSIVTRNTAVSGSLGLSVAVSPDVYALVEEHEPEAIWIQDGHQNELTAVLENDSDTRISSKVHFEIENAISGDTEETRCGGFLSAGPRDSFKFTFKIADLREAGVKIIKGITAESSIRCQPTGKILIASSRDVTFE